VEGLIVQKSLAETMAAAAVSESLKNKSPVLTIKRAGRQHNGQWQDFIDREQSSVDHLMKGSFATLCREFKENTTSAAGGALPQSMMHHNTIGGYKVRSKRSPNSSTEVSPLKDQELHGSSRTLPSCRHFDAMNR
jgi:uncharacterized protein (UPF0303 family)